MPEPWLRGPVLGVPALLQPAAHAFLMAREDIERAVSGLDDEQLWLAPGGAASIGYHLAHVTGSTDRLLTYARGQLLSETQVATLERERSITTIRPPLKQLLDDWSRTVAGALEQLSTTAESTLLEPRGVGRKQIPSTVLGLLFHAAEHASRHTGQIVTTAKLIRKEDS